MSDGRKAGSVHDASGSNWRKWDLHFHTPKSYDHKQKGKTAAQVVERLLKHDIAVVAVTDHHVLDADFIRAMQDAAKGRLTVLPGIELSSNMGGSDGVHFIGVFSEDAPLEYLSTELPSQLGISAMRQAGKEDGQIYVTLPDAAFVIQKLGGLVTIHAHGKHSNIETIKNEFRFKMEVKKDLLRERVDILEIGDPKHTRDYWDKVFPSIGFELPIIIASDDHWEFDYPAHKHCWIKADPTFSGLRMAIREPTNRFYLGVQPPSVEYAEKNKTKFIRSVSFKPLPSMPMGEKWLTGEVALNTGLVGIIGNKGSGKSALADAIGLLGSCTNSNSFSFLTEERFCNPKTGRAKHIECVLNWQDGTPVVRILSESVGNDDPERVKYLPQSFVENVCNDIAEPGGGAFERELKKVVFSKVDEADKLGRKTLDELIRFRTQEIRNEADALATTLIGLAERRSDLEDKQSPTVRSSIEKQIAQVKETIASHQAGKPVEVEKPTGAISPESAAAVESLKRRIIDTVDAIVKRQAQVTQQQLRAAVADKLIDKLKNLQAEFDRRLVDISSDAISLGLKGTDLASLIIAIDPVTTIRSEATENRDAARNAIDDPKDGLAVAKSKLETESKSIQEQLDGPNKAYQAYLSRLAEWQTQLNKLEGDVGQPSTLKGLNAELLDLDSLPKQIEEVQAEMFAVAKSIHALRVKEADVLRELYNPVQRFVTSHELARDRLNVEFEVELVQEQFVDAFVGHINQNRVGSFSGVDDGRQRASAMIAIVEWEKWESVFEFLGNVIEALHVDQRPRFGNAAVLAKSQIGKGKTLASLYSWLFGLSYVAPRYSLKSDGKRMEQLSPGERGTLLLVFYLLVDDSDVPLIIDQPEANLDNATVAKKLVACIRDARTRRQVIIVTHNPNLAVVCDADQIIHASLDIDDGHRVTYTTGGLEHPDINQFTIDVLEGGRVSFDKRDDTYVVCEKS